MIEPLQGVHLRVFRSLVRDGDWDTVEKIRVALTQGVEVPSEKIEEALAELAEAGYVEQFENGRRRVTPQGAAIKDSLIGTRYEEGTPVWVQVEGRNVAAEFVRTGEPDEGRNDPKVGVVRDVAWVRYLEGEDEGTLGTHFYRDIDLR